MIKAEEYLSGQEVANLGLGSCGERVFISRRAVIAHPQSLHLGDSIRIDAFCSFIGRGEVRIGKNVHIGTAVTISATASVRIGDYSGLASGVRLFTSDDDYSGASLTGPTVPQEHASLDIAPIEIRMHCVVGANSVILPGAVLEDGVVIGALSLAKGRYPAWGIYGGVPSKLLKARSQELLNKV